ncbi:MAG: YajQ family cyclic di-GMP-binding protein [Candidatus Omnitrophica bacterium]|nr:YajQ family cyclic di-GMP-binding protein [Candidatus Omnitrophota bacterium]
MAKETFSFDIVSEVNMHEMDNAVEQSKKELISRYDFKNTNSSIEYKRDEKEIILVSSNEFKLRALRDILLTRTIKRGICPKAIVFNNPESVFGNNVKQTVKISTGISKENAKEIVRRIKDLGLKVQSQIEGEKVRVSSSKKDDLQSVIGHIKAMDFPIPLSFNNYR